MIRKLTIKKSPVPGRQAKAIPLRRTSVVRASTTLDPFPTRPVLGTHSGRFTELDADKLRGGYYTSTEVAKWLSQWAIRDRKDRVLEPSCGDGVFLAAAATRLLDLGARVQSLPKKLVGVEIIADEATKSRSRLRNEVGLAIGSSVVADDFFSWWEQASEPTFDVVIGNPPFIRYQTFPEPHRTRAMDIMAKLGLTPNRLTNIWVPFVAVASACLRPGGRLALVLPAELLQVSYASQLRSFLTDRFSRIDIVTCNELFFSGAEQEVVLLLAHGALGTTEEGNTCRVAMTEMRSLGDLLAADADELIRRSRPKTVHHEREKWLKFFLTEEEIALMRDLRANQAITTLKEHATVDVGVVTGKNEFFVLTTEQVEKFRLKDYVVPLVSRSAHLKGTLLRRADWEELVGNGERVYLLDLNPFDGQKPTRAVRAYVDVGEEQNVHQGYKCSIREPWYAVPSVWVPDGFLFRQIYDFPRVVRNKADATSTDTIHRLRCAANPEKTISNLYTYLTAASAEIEGRSYGGGVLELEPTEAERLLVPAHLGSALSLQESDRLIRAGKLEAVLQENNRRILKSVIGLSDKQCTMLRDIWLKMRNRRLARKRRNGETSISPTPA